MNTPRSAWKSLAIYLAKFIVAGALLGWLSASGRLQFSDLALFFSDPAALLVNTGVWLLGPILLGGLRWHLLLGALRLPFTRLQVLRLQLLATFFNLALPSSLGGDGARYFYAPKSPAQGERTRVLLSLVMDRLVGLAGLFLTAAIGISWGGGAMWRDPALAPLVLFSTLGAAAMLVALGTFWWLPLSWIEPLHRRSFRAFPWLQRGQHILDALAAYRRRPAAILGAVLLSIVTHGVNIAYLQFLAHLLTGQTIAIATLASMVPIAVLVVAVPIAPGGLGVGHLAFERLFLLAGFTGGANVYNLMALGQMAMGLLGVIPYLLTRSRHHPPRPQEAPIKAAS